uniref:Uncharacterized protein n=1 Tax=Anguilla anguilla TaxID=7936 RepID=A0A0E9SBB8_ANGAN
MEVKCTWVYDKQQPHPDKPILDNCKVSLKSVC